MKSPEQQPTSQPEKSPADAGLDIDAAKKYLEEAYGPEKSTVIVDKSIPIDNKSVEKQKTESMPVAPELKPKKPLSAASIALDDLKKHLSTPEAYSSPNSEKATPEKAAEEKLPEEIGEGEKRQKEREIASEIIEKKPTVEELAERIKQEKARQESQVEAAKNGLIDLAKSIKEAREKKETTTETSLYEKVKEVFEVATGESLEKTVKEKAKIEAENEGFKIVTPEEYRKGKTTETQERIQQIKRTAIIKERWDMLSAQEKEKYFNGENDKNDQASIDSARIKFATELNGKIDAKRQELAKGKKGISISEDAFYDLMKRGFKSEDIKKAGFFDRLFYKGVIEITPLDKTDKRGPLIRTREYLAEMEVKVKKDIEDVAKEEIERKIIDGQKRWRGKKQRHTREIIQETAIKYEAEKKLKVKPEEKSQPKTAEALKSFEKIGDINKVVKKVEADIKIKKEQQKKIQELKKKIKQRKSLTSKEKTFLNKLDSAYRKETEK